MLPNRYIAEKLALEHRHQLLREAEHERALAMLDSPKHASHGLQGFAGKLGMFLIVLGTKLKQLEQRRDAVPSAPTPVK
jgi:hypothetical protein